MIWGYPHFRKPPLASRSKRKAELRSCMQSTSDRPQSIAVTWQMELKDRGIEDPGPAILLLQVNVPVTAGNLCVFWILVFTSFKFQTPGMAYLHSLQLRCCSMGDASPFMNLGHMMTAELLCHGGFQTWPSPKSSSWLAILNVRAKGLEHPKKNEKATCELPRFYFPNPSVWILDLTLL
jgi:hypothetical protein